MTSSMSGRSCPGEEGCISSSTSLELSPSDGVPGVSGEDGTAYVSNQCTTVNSGLNGSTITSLTPSVDDYHVLFI